MKQAGSIYDLYGKTMASLASGAWPGFLRTAAWNFRFDFPSQLLIYAQRPEATACYSFDDWHEKFDRRIKRNAKGIAILRDSSDSLSLDYVFDYADTYSRKGEALYHWSMTAEKEFNVSNALHALFSPGLPPAQDLRAAIIGSIDVLLLDNWDTLIEDLDGLQADCRLRDLSREEMLDTVRTLIQSSCQTMILERCGYDTEQELPAEAFAAIRYFDTPAALSALGNTVQSISKQVLREIAVTVAYLDKEHPNREETNDTQDSFNLSAGRGVPDPRSASARRKAAGTVRADAQGLSAGKPIQPIHQPSAVGNTDGAPAANRAGDKTPVKSDNRSASSSKSGSGQNREQLSLEHAHDSNSSSGRRTGFSGDHLHLTVITEEDKTAVICYGSGVEGGKYRISKAAADSEDQFGAFLREECGTGGHSFRYPDGRRGFVSHDHEGLHLHKPGCQEYLLSWDMIQKRILQLLSEDRYLTAEEHIQAERYWHMLNLRQKRLIWGESARAFIHILEKDTTDLAHLEESIRALVYENSELARQNLVAVLERYAQSSTLAQNKEALSMLHGLLRELKTFPPNDPSLGPGSARDASFHVFFSSAEDRGSRGGESVLSNTSLSEVDTPSLTAGNFLQSSDGTIYRILADLDQFLVLQNEKNEEITTLFYTTDPDSASSIIFNGSKADSPYAKQGESSPEAPPVVVKYPDFNGSNAIRLYSIDKSMLFASSQNALHSETIKSAQNVVKPHNFSTTDISGIIQPLDILPVSVLQACITAILKANTSDSAAVFLPAFNRVCTLARDDLLVLNDREYEVTEIENDRIFVHITPPSGEPDEQFSFSRDALANALEQGIASITPGWKRRNADILYMHDKQSILYDLLRQSSERFSDIEAYLQGSYFHQILDRILNIRISSDSFENTKSLLYLASTFSYLVSSTDSQSKLPSICSDLITNLLERLSIPIDAALLRKMFRAIDWQNGGEQALYQDLTSLCLLYFDDILPTALRPLTDSSGQYTPFDAIPVLHEYLTSHKPTSFSSEYPESTYHALMHAAYLYREDRSFLYPDRSAEPLIDHPEALPYDLSRLGRADKVLLADLLMFYSSYHTSYRQFMPTLSSKDLTAYLDACEKMEQITVSEDPAVNISHIDTVIHTFLSWFLPFSAHVPQDVQNTLNSLLNRAEQLDAERLLSEPEPADRTEDKVASDVFVSSHADMDASDGHLLQEDAGLDWERCKSDPIANAGSIMLALPAGSNLLKASYQEILDYFRLNEDTGDRIRYLQEQVYAMGTYHEFGEKGNRMGFVGRDEYLYVWTGGTYTDHAAAHAYPWSEAISLISEQLQEHDSLTPSLFDFSFEQDGLSDTSGNSLTTGVLYDTDPSAASDSILTTSHVPNYSFTIVNDRIYFREGSELQPITMSKSAAARVQGLIRLRDDLYRLIAAQRSDQNDQTISALQKTLHHDYDAFAAKYGLINSPSNARAFSDDSAYYLLCALEHVTDKGEYLGKSDLFFKRILQPAAPTSSAHNAQDALFLSMREHGRVDLDFMSAVSGLSRQDLLCQLKGQIFEVPGIPGFYELAAIYLSGNVRKKLALARQAEAATPGIWSENIKALETVQPKARAAKDITARLGDPWISKEDISQFIYDLFETPLWHRNKDHICAEYSPQTDTWHIRNKDWDKNNIRATTTYGTKRLSGYHLLENALNEKEAKVYDMADGKQTLNQKETFVAQKQQQLICERFQTWVLSDPVRAERISKAYTDWFSPSIPPTIDDRFLRFHDLNPLVSFTAEEKTSIAGMLFSGSAICHQSSGNAQTRTIIATAMESKALGLSKKPMFIVPNQMIGKWTSAVYELYPGAKVLAVKNKDLEPQNRKKLYMRIAHGDFDMIVIGQKQFEQIPVSSAQKAAALKSELESTASALTQAKQDQSLHFSIKQLEQRKRDLETALKKAQACQTDGDTPFFDSLGIDRLFIAEGLYPKKLFSNINLWNAANLSGLYSERAFDLFLKFRQTAAHYDPAPTAVLAEASTPSLGLHTTIGRSLDSLIDSAAARRTKPSKPSPKQLSYATS